MAHSLSKQTPPRAQTLQQYNNFEKVFTEFTTSYPITSTFMLIKEKLLSTAVSNKNQEIFTYKTCTEVMRTTVPVTLLWSLLCQ